MTLHLLFLMFLSKMLSSHLYLIYLSFERLESIAASLNSLNMYSLLSISYQISSHLTEIIALIRVSSNQVASTEEVIAESYFKIYQDYCFEVKMDEMHLSFLSLVFGQINALMYLSHQVSMELKQHLHPTTLYYSYEQVISHSFTYQLKQQVTQEYHSSMTIDSPLI